MLPIRWNAKALDELDAIAGYIVVYRVLTDRVEIVGVLHVTREYP